MPLSKNEIKFIRSLQQKKNRDRESLFIVEGVKLVKELLSQNKYKIKKIYCTDKVNLKFNFDLLPYSITTKELKQISSLKTPNQTLAVVHKNTTDQIDLDTPNLSLMLDDIKDPGNLGTIIRTADWFGVQQIICSSESVDIYNPKVIQSTMGAIFRVNVFYKKLSTVISRFSKANFEILTADMDGENALNKAYKKKSVLIMGSESHGISEDISKLSQAITIPSYGKTESLNVAIASSIICSCYVKINR